MTCVHKVRWSVKRPEDCRFRLSVSHYKDRIVAPDEYTGATEVTPSDQTQVLATKDKLVREDITVTGITGTQVITQNGEYDVVDKATVIVNNPAQWTTEGIADRSEPYGDIDLGDATIAADYAFYKCSGITSVIGKNVTELGVEPFSYCDNLEKLSLPNAASMTRGYVSPFRSCFKLKEVHLPRIQFPTTDSVFGGFTIEFVYLPSTKVLPTNTFNACSALETVIVPNLNTINGHSVFINCSNLKTLLIGNAKPAGLGNINSFSGTPFAEGGSGGDIYIPKALYDHLGDGSNLDYLKNSVWNTLNGYGTITWHPIEGSEYETYMPGGEKYEEEMALT
jgi:hypothetical protein